MENNIPNRILELVIAIQQIPAPTFEEAERAAFMRARFLEEGLQDAGMGEAGNVLARLPGGDAKPLIVSAHLDTVFPRETDLHIRWDAERIHGPGIGDNSMGLGALFGILGL